MNIEKILILAANPIKEAILRLDKEVEEIRTTLLLSPNRDRFVIESRGAVRPQDLQQHLFNLKPQILHFSGHGGGDLGLAFEADDGRVKLVSTEALANLFKLFAKEIQCVVLNACYAEVQAKAICQHIPYAIGMNQKIGDEAARKFAEGFYRAIWDDRSIEDAFASGVNAIALEGIPEELTPVLIKGNCKVTASETEISVAGNNVCLPMPVQNILTKAQQLKLQHLQKKDEDLNKKVQKVQAEIGAVVDILTKDALENRLNLLFDDIEKVQQEIQKLEQGNG